MLWGRSKTFKYNRRFKYSNTVLEPFHEIHYGLLLRQIQVRVELVKLVIGQKSVRQWSLFEPKPFQKTILLDTAFRKYALRLYIMQIAYICLTYKQNLLESSEKLHDDSSDVRNECVDSQRPHRSEYEEQLSKRVDFDLGWHPKQNSQASLQVGWLSWLVLYWIFCLSVFIKVYLYAFIS